MQTDLSAGALYAFSPAFEFPTILSENGKVSLARNQFLLKIFLLVGVSITIPLTIFIFSNLQGGIM
jgi:hypothetical protein